jgi:hypothetical protein
VALIEKLMNTATGAHVEWHDGDFSLVLGRTTA